MRRIQKRGQVTMFIILGIVILFSVGLYLYLQTRTTVFELEQQMVPSEMLPIYQHIQSCMETIGTEAVWRLGLQGGYVEVPEHISRDASAYLALDPAGILRLPYWDHKGKNRIPSLAYMEDQISGYVNITIIGCVDNFSAYRDEYNIEYEQPQFETEIAEEDVVIRSAFKIQAEHKLKGGKKTIENFRVEIPVRLKKAYELAVQIMETEKDILFMENLTVNLMAASPKIPFSGMEVKCGSSKWKVSELRNELALLLYYNLPLVKIKDTANAEFLAPLEVYENLRGIYTGKDAFEGKSFNQPVPDDAYEYFHSYFDVGNTHKELKTAFMYRPEWGMDFKADPSRGDEMSSKYMTGHSKYLRFFCLNLYHFTYNVQYPAHVRIHDDDSLNGAGFNFNIAFPVMIHNNRGERLEFPYQFFETGFYDEEFCSNIGVEEYEVYVRGTDEDGIPARLLDGVNISYQCFDKLCPLGSTMWEPGTHYYRLKTRLPAGCANPLILADKDGYLQGRQQMLGDKVDINIKKLQRMNFTIAIHRYDSAMGNMSDDFVMLDPKLYNATLFIELYNSSLTQYKSYPAQLEGEEYGEYSQDHIDLVGDGGVYNIDVMLSVETYGGTELVGGYNNDNLAITAQDIKDKGKMIIHVFEYRPSPFSDEQKGEMVNYMLNGDYRQKLRPTFVVD